ncbi:MAG: hypothetical protein JO248_06400, partial [Acidimicrobiia bacterium]|nr:hypothetical protein [Acidimicrobiia bacterium]
MRVRARLWPTAAVALLVGAFVPLATSQRAAADTTLTTCDEASLRAAVQQGGVVRYGVPCMVNLTQTITIPAGLDVTIDGNGQGVQLNGQQLVRHFEVDGGHLTVARLALQWGKVTGTNGTAGGAGANGTAGATGTL